MLPNRESPWQLFPLMAGRCSCEVTRAGMKHSANCRKDTCLPNCSLPMRKLLLRTCKPSGAITFLMLPALPTNLRVPSSTLMITLPWVIPAAVRTCAGTLTISPMLVTFRWLLPARARLFLRVTPVQMETQIAPTTSCFTTWAGCIRSTCILPTAPCPITSSPAPMSGKARTSAIRMIPAIALQNMCISWWFKVIGTVITVIPGVPRLTHAFRTYRSITASHEPA